ncbi:MAG: ThiF family adenylyltransferase [Candidatus Xenobiia bacterium LiM19]
MKITICGAGTLGGNIAESLVRMGFKSLTVIDRDRVEERNLSNQPYGNSDVGQPKVKALSVNLYRAVGAEVSGVFKEMTAGNGEKLLDGSELVIDAFDNSESRKTVKETCERLRKPCLHMGLSNDGYGEVIWNEHYKVPPPQQGDPCEEPLSRNLSLLVVAIASEMILEWSREGKMRDYCVTLKDLTISSL